MKIKKLLKQMQSCTPDVGMTTTKIDIFSDGSGRICQGHAWGDIPTEQSQWYHIDDAPGVIKAFLDTHQVEEQHGSCPG